MKLVYKSFLATGYKAIENQLFNLNKGGADIKGANGTGKSTLIGMPAWVFADRDLDNNSNPSVRPVDSSSTNHSVSITFSVDDEVHVVVRSQKSTDSGSTSNEYFIDGVPKKKKEFETWLDDLGLSKDKFLVLSNPNIFCSKKTDEARSLLMEMGKVTDDEIMAEVFKTHKCNEVRKHIADGLSLDDIKAKATYDKKTITDIHGKKGEITSTKITALKQILEMLKTKNGTKQAQQIVTDMLGNTVDMQAKYEQDIADCERLLYQVNLINDSKIVLITDKINSHFKYVDFKFWEEDTKGNLKPCCIPMIDGYELGESMNTGKEVLAKIDIINGLQEFYDCYIPILLDNAECLSKDTVKKIKVKSQVLMGSVTDDKKLKIN